MKKLATLCARAGHERDAEFAGTRPASVPIVQSSAFEIDALETLEATSSGALHTHVYTRVSNPTTSAFEHDMCALEGAERALGFGSGMAAFNAVIAGHVQAGDHVVCAEQIYGVSYASLAKLFAGFSVSVTFVDTTDASAVAKAFRSETKLLVAETLSNPTLVVADIPMLARVAHAHGAKLFVDNTFASPILCRPLALGADIVMHSASKYLGGHSDVIAGVVLGSTAVMKPIFQQAILLGATLDPFASFLLLRGLKTLALRMERQCDNAEKIARAMRAHEGVERVYYPDGQLSGRGGAVVSIVLRGEVGAFVAALATIPIVTTLGGVSTTITLPALSSHRSVPAAERVRLGVVDKLVRLSIGIEDADDLIAELTGALG